MILNCKFIYLENCEVELYHVLVTRVGEFSTLNNSLTELYNFKI